MIFVHSTNQIIDLCRWRYRYRYPRHFLKSLLDTLWENGDKANLKWIGHIKWMVQMLTNQQTSSFGVLFPERKKKQIML